MNRKVCNTLIFAAGAAIGAVSAWYFAKKRCDAEIASVKETFTYRKVEEPESEPEAEAVSEPVDISSEPVTTVTDELGARVDALDNVIESVMNDIFTPSDPAIEARKAVDIASNSIYGVTQAKPDNVGYDRRVEELGYAQPRQFGDRPHVISPEEFGEYEDYDLITLVYFLDGVLADTDNNPVEDIEKVIGKDSLNHFGEYEDDAVYVRNDRLKCDYEVLLDQREFMKAVKKRLH